ncbi:hypothetical protein ACFL7M_12585 [Thermodesulfobacteriota bacterium]
MAKTAMNLISNAAEAMPKGGKMVISTEKSHIDTMLNNKEFKPGDYGKRVMGSALDIGHFHSEKCPINSERQLHR